MKINKKFYRDTSVVNFLKILADMKNKLWHTVKNYDNDSKRIN